MKQNKIIYAFIFFLLAFSYNIYYFSKYDYPNKESFINKSYFEVKDSNILEKGERGLFATKNYKKNDVIETCPTLIMNHNEVSNSNILNYHFFKGNNKKNSLLSLGYCSIINHSDSKQNCTWKVSNDDNTITMYATKPILKGEEIYSNYGKSYWSNKKNKI